MLSWGARAHADNQPARLVRREHIVNFTDDPPDDRNAPLLLNGHPIAGGVARGFFGFDRPCLLNGAAEKQQFFGEGGFPRIRMADDAEGSPAIDLFLTMVVHNLNL